MGSQSGRRLRVALVASYAPSLTLFRGKLIEEMLARGHSVLCLAPDFDDGLRGGAVRKELIKMGAACRTYRLERTGLNPLADMQSVKELAAIFRDWRPDIVTGYTSKPAIYCAIAGRLASVPRVVPMITGLGYAFAEEGGAKLKLVRKVTNTLYRLAFARSHAAIFHNGDDLRHLRSLGLVPDHLQVHVVAGSGVNLDEFAPAPLPPAEQGLSFLMIARLVRYKGVGEFCAAAETLKRRFPDCRWRLVGPEEGGPAGFGVAELAKYRRSVDYGGPSDNIAAEIAACHVYVLPSYGEGMPRTVLEALATGRPIITTDTRGCRDTVDEVVNGKLVPVGDARALGEAMAYFIEHRDMLPAMGRASRQKAERTFDVRLVNEATLSALGIE